MKFFTLTTYGLIIAGLWVISANLCVNLHASLPTVDGRWNIHKFYYQTHADSVIIDNRPLFHEPGLTIIA